jgi:PAS domain S-box-containing protein
MGFGDDTHLKNSDLKQSMRLIKELEIAQNRLKITANALPAFVAYVSPDERYQFTNRKYTEWFGLSSEDLFDKKLKDVLGSDAYGRSKPFIDRVLKGESVTFETQIEKHNKKLKVIVSYIPDIDPATGKIRGFALMGQDVTTLREAQVATEVSESRFRTIFQQSPLAIQLFSLDGVCTDANDA